MIDAKTLRELTLKTKEEMNAQYFSKFLAQCEERAKMGYFTYSVSRASVNKRFIEGLEDLGFTVEIEDSYYTVSWWH